MDIVEAIRTRRSYGRLTEPGPTDEDLRQILEAGAAACDDPGLRPYRLTVVRGRGFEALGKVLEQAYYGHCASAGLAPSAEKAHQERARLRRAPLLIVVSTHSQRTDEVSEIDRRISAAAAAQDILLAAHALGYGAKWRTGRMCEEDLIRRAFGCSRGDAIVAFLYVGTPEKIKPPKQVNLDGLVQEYRP